MSRNISVLVGFELPYLRGKKRLAYEIKKLNEGYYVVVKFEAKPELITELERVYRITDEVMKFIVVKEEE